MADMIRQMGYLALGSRMKRLGERLQGDVLRVIQAADIPVQPGQMPLLAALDDAGPMTISAMVDATGVSQPAVTRSLARLVELGLVEVSRIHRDQRHKTVALTANGRALLARSKREVWPQVEAAVTEICAGLSGSLLEQLDGLETALTEMPLDRRVASGLSIHAFDDTLASEFHDINAEWIETMFRLEPTDREVLENPRERILAPGGDILFVEAAGLGIVGTCALQKTGERQFELTKMGVRASARGRKAGEYLLAAVIRRAAALDAENLYLMTNSKCAAAIHLYQKLGFVHDEATMRDFGARYERCNVAMRYLPSRSISAVAAAGARTFAPEMK